MAHALFADQDHRIYDHPALELAGQSGQHWVPLSDEDLVPLPEGTKLFVLPGRAAVGWDAAAQTFSPMSLSETAAPGESWLQGEPLAVAAFLPAGYTRLHLPAVALSPSPPSLPLWTYTAVGWADQGFAASALRVDPMDHSEAVHYDDRYLVEKIEVRLQDHPDNRLLHHLKHCAVAYHCFAAKNLFMQRWEAPLPSSPACNAGCVGCLSHQDREGCDASHARIDFVPSVSELAAVALPHLNSVPRGIVSFGQGCEGEPLLQADLITRVVRRLRETTDRGTLHLNTNGFDPEAVVRLAQAGLDSIRISLNSAREETYLPYYRPRQYRFLDVVSSICRARDAGLYTAVNLLVFPGITDQEREVAALLKLIRRVQPDMVHMRNLSIDPEIYLRLFPSADAPGIGVRHLIHLLRREFPELELGYFNRPKELFGQRLIEEMSL
jgi:pyruvate-formate lyase-activating enzyme